MPRLVTSVGMTTYKWSFNPDNDEEVTKHYNKLFLARKAAIRTPFSVAFEFECALSRPSVAGPTARPLPPFLHSDLETNGKHRLQLVRPVQYGLDKWSQVWLANVLSSAGCSNDSSPLVVVKFIQPSFLRLPHPESDITWEYREPEEVAMREAEFYNKAVELQGNVIPYFFGVHKIKSPSLEMSWALVLEYVEGPTLDAHIDAQLEAQSMGSEKQGFDQVCQLYARVLQRLHEAHLKDMIFGDIRSSNIILTLPSCVPVFIDFSFGDIIEQDRFKEQERLAVYGIFKSWPDYGEKVVAWGQETSLLNKEQVPNFNPPPPTKSKSQDILRAQHEAGRAASKAMVERAPKG